MSLVPDVCTNVADWKLSKKTHKPFPDTNWNKASFKLNKTLDGLQQVRQLETHQNPSSNSFLHVCELYQLTTTAKKKQPPTYRTTKHWPLRPFTKKTWVHRCFFWQLDGSRWVTSWSIHSPQQVIDQLLTEKNGEVSPRKPMEVKFTYGNSPKGNLRNLTKKHLQTVEVLKRCDSWCFLGFFV